MSKKEKKVKEKRKLTPAEKRAKKERRKKYMYIFVRGKQKRVKRPETIDGMDADEWFELNADDITLHTLGYHEILHARQQEEERREYLKNNPDAEDITDDDKEWFESMIDNPDTEDGWSEYEIGNPDAEEDPF